MAGLSSQGVTLGIDNTGAGTTYTTIAEITSIDGPGGSTNQIDVSSFDTQGYVERIAGLRDAGEVSVEMNLDPTDTTGQMELQTQFNGGSSAAYEITLTDTAATTLNFKAIVTAFSISMATDDKISASATLSLSGAVTWS